MRNSLAASGLVANFGTIQLYMTCWAASAVVGPFNALTKNTSSATDGLACWAERQAEMELRMYDSCPAIRPWLLDAGFHPKTSSVIDCLNSLAMNSTAATVSGELSVTFSLASCSPPP